MSALNSSVFVEDQEKGLYAVGYRHGQEAVKASEILESSLDSNENKEILTPMEFLSEWHRLNITAYENPSEVTVTALEKLEDLTEADDFHYHVEMHEGYVHRVAGWKQGKKTFTLTFEKP